MPLSLIIDRISELIPNVVHELSTTKTFLVFFKDFNIVFLSIGLNERKSIIYGFILFLIKGKYF